MHISELPEELDIIFISDTMPPKSMMAELYYRFKETIDSEKASRELGKIEQILEDGEDKYNQIPGILEGIEKDIKELKKIKTRFTEIMEKLWSSIEDQEKELHQSTVDRMDSVIMAMGLKIDIIKTMMSAMGM